MQRRPLALVEPIARVERQELQFGSFRQVRRLIDHEASGTNSRFDGHADERSIGQAAQQANGAVAAKALCKRGRQVAQLSRVVRRQSVEHMNHVLLEAARAIQSERYPDSDAVLVAGSLIRGEGTAYSDLDLVVVYSTLPAAYRESFRFGPYPVEAFVHDPSTLEYFFTEVDRPTGIPALAQMVAEGIEIPEPTPLTRQLKNRATEILDGGPPPLTGDAELRLRYAVSDALDDLRGAGTSHESMAVGSQLFEALANYYFRSHGFWSARGKAIPRHLARRDARLAARYAASVESLFRAGDVTPVIELAEAILEPKGGVLFDGYRSDAPAEWRAIRP